MNETNGPDAPDEPCGDAGPDPASDGDDSLRETLEEAERERDQFRAMMLRAQADLVNYRRRVEDERETLKRNVTSSLLIDMLELVTTSTARWTTCRTTRWRRSGWRGC